MKRVVTVVVLVGLVALPLTALLPRFVPAVVRAHGVSVQDARWCAAGLCMDGAVAGRVHADRATLGWDGVLRLVDVAVASDEGPQGAAARAEPAVERTAAELPSMPFVREVWVENLTIGGTPLPPLSGEVLPKRHLSGEKARIDGDEAELVVPTEYGEVTVTITRGEPGHHLVADCSCTLADEALGGTLTERHVHADGNFDDGHFSGSVEVEGIHGTVEATLGTAARVTGRFVLPDTPLTTVYAALGEVVPEARRAEIHGSIAATGRFTLAPFSLHVEPTVSGFAVDGLVGDVYHGGRLTWMGHDAAGQDVPRQGGDDDARWRPLAAMGRYLPMAVIAAEDGQFLRHPGYDLEGMLAAEAENATAGKVVRGGSTLTQQLAKNLFLRGTRTYARKLSELLYAVELERELGKPRILELYLNVVEWGPDIVGAQAAAEAYFLKEPKGLLPEEAAFLASILRSPRGSWAKEYAGGRVNGRRLAWILDNMVGLDPAERAEALARDVHFVPPAE